MKTQNQTKRTIISFSIAFATAMFTLFIQDIRNDKLIEEQHLEAQVYPESTLLLQK